MPVGAGSIKRAAKSAAVKPESEKTENAKAAISKTTIAKDTKKQPKADGSITQKVEKGPERLGNQVYHITDELPVHLL